MPTAAPELDETQLQDLSAALDAVLSWTRRVHPSAGYSMTARSTAARLFSDGPTRISDLARAEGVTQPAMTGLVNRLEGDGLVVRNPDPADARASLVVLTEQGRAFIAERRAQRARQLADRIAQLSDDDRLALVAASPALRRLSEIEP